MSGLESLLAERDQLRAEVSKHRRTCRELADAIESHETAAAGPEAVAKETRRLEGLIRTVTATAGQWETTTRELRREVWALRRRLEARS